MAHYNFKTANVKLHDGETVKMITTDFRSHTFSRNRGKYGKPVVHVIEKSVGRPLILHLTWDEFENKFKNNEFTDVATL